MTRRLFRASARLTVALLLLPLGQLPASAQAGGAARRCSSSLVGSWSPGGSRAYRVEATVAGRTCGSANVALVVRGVQRRPMLTFTSAAADLPYPFSGAASSAEMTVALRRWTRQPQIAATTRDLPPWPADAIEPWSGTMVFSPEPMLDRTRYSDLRRQARPTFCFAEGGGRIACYALGPTGDDLMLIGTIARGR